MEVISSPLQTNPETGKAQTLAEEVHEKELFMIWVLDAPNMLQKSPSVVVADK